MLVLSSYQFRRGSSITKQVRDAAILQGIVVPDTDDWSCLGSGQEGQNDGGT